MTTYKNTTTYIVYDIIYIYKLRNDRGIMWTRVIIDYTFI